MSKREAILLVRLDGIGDAALCIPALEGLSRAFAGAAFGAVCSPANAALFSDRVERIHIYDQRVPMGELCEEMQAQRYSRVLIATEEVAGYKIGRLSGARMRAGFWHGLQKPFKSMWQHAQVTSAVYRPAAWSKTPEHEVETLYRLALALGATQTVPSDPVKLRTWLRIEPFVQAPDLEGALAFQVSPKLMTAGWGPSALAQLVSTVMEASEVDRVALIASGQDEGLACSVMEHIPAATRANRQMIVLASLTLPRWLGVLDSVAVLVTPDTGAAHVAGMLGVPVIDLFDEPDFERLSRQWRPWAGPSRSCMKPRWRAEVQTSFGRQVGEAVRALGRARSNKFDRFIRG